MSIQDQIKKTIADNKVVLYMKGTPEQPQCGFSAKVVKILHELKVPFTAVDVLADPEIRQGIKDYANRPTIPQLYINQEFIGGCDIVTEMFASKELHPLFDK